MDSGRTNMVEEIDTKDNVQGLMTIDMKVKERVTVRYFKVVTLSEKNNSSKYSLRGRMC